MSSFVAARSIFRSTSSARNATAARFASKGKAKTSPSVAPFRSSGNRSSNNKLLSQSILRRPVELSSGLETLIPFHSVTASALMTSMLSISRGSYGWLLEACNDDV